MSHRLFPNSTQIPNVIFDKWMPHLSGAEFKVVMFIARKTYGWGERPDTISIAQMATGTGLSARAVEGAVLTLTGKGILKPDSVDDPWALYDPSGESEAS